MKVLYNTCYGGYGLSEAFVKAWNKRHPTKKMEHVYDAHDVDRADPDMIAVVEELGLKESSGHGAALKIDEIPDGVEYHIAEYDGMERVEWSLPKNTIIQELVDVLWGRLKEEETSKFTQMVLKEEGDVSQVLRTLQAGLDRRRG